MAAYSSLLLAAVRATSRAADKAVASAKYYLQHEKASASIMPAGNTVVKTLCMLSPEEAKQTVMFGRHAIAGTRMHKVAPRT